MEAAWQQVGKVLEGNTRIRFGHLAMFTSMVWHRRELARTVEGSGERLLGVTAPVHQRVLSDGRTIAYAMRQSTVPQALVGTTVRKVLRPRAAADPARLSHRAALVRRADLAGQRRGDHRRAAQDGARQPAHRARPRGPARRRRRERRSAPPTGARRAAPGLPVVADLAVGGRARPRTAAPAGAGGRPGPRRGGPRRGAGPLPVAAPRARSRIRSRPGLGGGLRHADPRNRRRAAEQLRVRGRAHRRHRAARGAGGAAARAGLADGRAVQGGAPQHLRRRPGRARAARRRTPPAAARPGHRLGVLRDRPDGDDPQAGAGRGGDPRRGSAPS